MQTVTDHGLVFVFKCNLLNLQQETETSILYKPVSNERPTFFQPMSIKTLLTLCEESGALVTKLFICCIAVLNTKSHISPLQLQLQLQLQL